MLKSIDLMQSGQWYEDDTYYQILLVESCKSDTLGNHIQTTVVTKTRKDFKNYQIHPSPRENISLSENQDISENIGSQLPSPGVTFIEGFRQALFSNNTNFTDINNFYEPIRILLITRKMSQLIAKTWYSYLEAGKKDSNLWNLFINDQWDQIPFDILNGLIAREIFLSDYKSTSLKHEPNDLSIYGSLYVDAQNDKKRFLILPSSRAWQKVALSLLLAGQAYYKVKDESYYHQISPPILSTGEIVMKYGIDVAYDQFTGVIKEVSVSPGEYSTAFPISIPYPPIPSQDNLSFDRIEEWANAQDEDGKFPFYSKLNNEYTINVENFTPPFPYLPLSCC